MTERFSAPGATLVKLFGRPEEEAREFGERAERVRDIGVRTAMVSRVFVTALSLVSALAQALVYGLGGYLAVTGAIAAGHRGHAGAAAHPALHADDGAGERPGRRHDGAGVVRAGLRGARPAAVDHRAAGPAAAAAPGRSRCALRDVHFAYPGAERVSLASLEEVAVLDRRVNADVLHGVDLEVGRRPAAGAGRAVGRGEVDDRRAGPAALRRRPRRASSCRGSTCATCRSPRCAARSGWSTQDGHLFHDTIAANLRYAAPEATDAELVEALHRARLGDLLDALPDGLATMVGERGYRLSGGERQRLTIARLLLARPRVVILDEATAHLDSESEVAVQAALAEALEGRTAIVIAHRLSTVRAADEIAVVEGGRVVERGTHDGLLAAGGATRRSTGRSSRPASTAATRRWSSATGPPWSRAWYRAATSSTCGSRRNARPAAALS